MRKETVERISKSIVVVRERVQVFHETVVTTSEAMKTDMRQQQIEQEERKAIEAKREEEERQATEAKKIFEAEEENYTILTNIDRESTSVNGLFATRKYYMMAINICFKHLPL